MKLTIAAFPTRRTVGRRVVAALAVILALPVGLGAQDQPGATPIPPLMIGSRVRILTKTSTDKVVGTVMQMDEKALIVSTDDHIPVSVPREAVVQLDVSRGRHRHVLKGTLIGAGIGGALFAAVGNGCFAGCSGSNSDTGSAVATGLFGGALWGAGIGAFIKGDRWSPVPLERVRVSLTPTRGRGLSLSVSF